MASQRITRMLLKPRNIAIITGSILSIKLLPDVFPQYMFRPLYQGYHGGTKRMLNDSQLEEFREVCNDLGVNAERYRPFVTGRWDVEAKGISWMPNGVQFGIPVSFVKKPNVSSVRFSCGLKTNMNTDDGKSFQESFILNKTARKWALAVQVARIESGHNLAPAFLLSSCFLAGYASSFAILPMLNFLPRFAVLLGVGSAYFIVYKLFLGQINGFVDLLMDKKVAKLTTDYAKGGLEFYEKKLQRNRALRTLMEAKGKKLYTYYGNENKGVFYSANAPLTQRREAIKKMTEHIGQTD